MDSTPLMENQAEQKMKSQRETGVDIGLDGKFLKNEGAHHGPQIP